jgi:hypothetical protein
VGGRGDPAKNQGPRFAVEGSGLAAAHSALQPVAEAEGSGAAEALADGAGRLPWPGAGVGAPNDELFYSLRASSVAEPRATGEHLHAQANEEKDREGSTARVGARAAESPPGRNEPVPVGSGRPGLATPSRGGLLAQGCTAPPEDASRPETLETEGGLRPNPSAEPGPSEELLIWEVDYGDPERPGSIPYKTTANLEGVRMMIINDHKQVYYPILQVHVQGLTMALEDKAPGLRGDTDIRVMASYYNKSLDAWEPLLERAHLRLSAEQDELQSRVHAGFRGPVNLNFSEELFENVLPAYIAFQKAQSATDLDSSHQPMAEEAGTARGGPGPSERLPGGPSCASAPADSRAGQSAPTHQALVAERTKEPRQLPGRAGTGQSLPPASTVRAQSRPLVLARRRNLEFKVAPYRVVNLTAKKLMIRRCDLATAAASRALGAQDLGQTRAPAHGTHAGSSDAAGRHGQQSRQGPQGSTSRGQPGRFQNNLARHPILQHSQLRQEGIQHTGAAGTGARQGHQALQGFQSSSPAPPVRKSQLPGRYPLDSGGSVDFEVDDEEEARQLIRSSNDDRARRQTFIDIIFDEGRSERDKIRAYNLSNLGLHQHPFSSEPYDFVIFGMSPSASEVRKTFVLRSPFVIYNKTESTYMLKIVKHQTSEEKVLKLAPGEGYPLSLSELRAKIMLCTGQDFASSEANPPRQEEIWSSHFKVSNFLQKPEISKKKFFVYHARQFSMVFLQPGEFFPSWDICIKVPLVVRNALPVGLRLRTHLVRRYVQPRSPLLSSQTKKEIVSEKAPAEYSLEKQGS